MEKEIIEILKRLETKVDDIGAKVDKLEAKVDKLEAKVDENTEILRALEHSAEVAKSERDKMAVDIAHIKGDIKAIKKDVTNVEIITASNWSDISKMKINNM